VITLAGTTTAVPCYPLRRTEVQQALRTAFQLDERRLATALAIVDHAQVEQRYGVFPLEYLIRPRSLTQTTQEYREHALGLARQVAQCCLEQAGLDARAVDLIITVSCTGYMIPSLDAYLINDLGFRPDVRRLPITELGCIAGAMALSQAWSFVRACPGATVLVVAVELPSLTFQPHDTSTANIVATALFGDGAAAALVTGQPLPGVEIVGTQSALIPGTLGDMGYDLRDSGFHMVLSKDVPAILREQIGRLSTSFLAQHGLSVEQIAAFALHPGGKKILEYLEEELQLRREQTQPSWTVLRNYGNLSSAAILFVLHEWLTTRALRSGQLGLAAGFGPGLSAELLLLRWT
jgi:alkylresorcinol/alkylpyrone synthase